MRKFLLPFCILISCAQPAFAVVTECNNPPEGGKCQNGCKYDAPSQTCIQCPENTYGDGAGGCTPCLRDFPASSAGAESVDECHQECNIQPGCDGHHLEERKCEPNVKIEGNNLSVWDTVAYLGPYTIGCPNDSHLKITGQECGRDIGTCESNRGLCTTKLNNCPGGKIDGDYEWSPTTREYDYSNCTCKTGNMDGPNGKYTTTCGWASGSGNTTQWKTGNDCIRTATECNTGFCVPAGETECATVPAGYYSVNTSSTECTKCPLGSMSEPGATAIIQCYIERGKTRFSDNNGTIFTLPGSGNLNYAPRAP